MKKLLLLTILVLSTLSLTSCGKKELTPEMQSIYDQMEISDQFDSNLQKVLNNKRHTLLDNIAENKLEENQDELIIIETCQMFGAYFKASDYNIIVKNSNADYYYALEEAGKNSFNLIIDEQPKTLADQKYLVGALEAIKEGNLDTYAKSLKIPMKRYLAMIHKIDKDKASSTWKVKTYFFEY